MAGLLTIKNATVIGTKERVREFLEQVTQAGLVTMNHVTFVILEKDPPVQIQVRPGGE